MGLSKLEIARIGRGLDLTNVFSGVSGKVGVNDGTTRINQSLRVIFESGYGEVAMLPVIGSNLDELLFEPSDSFLKDKVDLYIREAINNLEPRIQISDLVIDLVENYVYVTVSYLLSGTNIAGKFNYELIRGSEGDVQNV